MIRVPGPQAQGRSDHVISIPGIEQTSKHFSNVAFMMTALAGPFTLVGLKGAARGGLLPAGGAVAAARPKLHRERP